MNDAGIVTGLSLLLLPFGFRNTRKKTKQIFFFFLLVGLLFITACKKKEAAKVEKPQTVITKNVSYAVTDLEPNQLYYWKIVGYGETETIESEVNSFRTAPEESSAQGEI